MKCGNGLIRLLRFKWKLNYIFMKMALCYLKGLKNEILSFNLLGSHISNGYFKT